MKKLLSLGLIMGMMFNTSFAGQETRNGGDGVYRDGEIVLRDFLEAEGLTKVKSNREFIKTAPTFIKIIRKIGEKDRALAVALYSAIVDSTIWTTNNQLPLLPDSETTLYERKADVQIAIRDRENIYISLPAYNKTDKGYLLLHEAAHLIAGGEGAEKHFNVRAFVRNVKDNINSLNTDELNNYLSHRFITYKSDIISYQNNEVLSALVDKKGSFENKCELAGFVIDHKGFFKLLEIFNPEMLDCLNEGKSSRYYAKMLVVKYADTQSEISSFRRVEPKKRVLKNKKYQEEKALCEENTNADIGKQIDIVYNSFAKLKDEIDTVYSEYKQEEDAAKKMYLKLVYDELIEFTHNLQYSSYRSRKFVSILEAKDAFENNIKKCRDANYL